MSEAIDVFLTTLPLHECISELKALRHKYVSVQLEISVEPLDTDNYRFEMRGTGISRNPMNMTLYGHLKQLTPTSTQVSVKEIVSGTSGYYLTQYLWLTSPIILIAALISGNPSVLFGIPLVIVFSLATLVIKQQDKEEMLRILYRAFGSDDR